MNRKISSPVILMSFLLLIYVLPVINIGYIEIQPMFIVIKSVLDHGKSTSSSSAPTTYPPYIPAQIQQAYSFSLYLYTVNNGVCTGYCGQGETIAIVDAYGSPTIVNDVKVFNSQFGLPQFNSTNGPKFYIVYPEGKPSRSDSGWAVETSLDVEWAHAIAPLANIVLVVAKSASLSDMFNAVNAVVQEKIGVKANVISMSWGSSEFSTQTSYDSIFINAVNLGITPIASSGDSGSEEYPSTSPYVLSVGGTTLTLTSLSSTGAKYSGETTWTSSGGGYSTYEPEPSYQVNVIPDPSKTRGNPDVAYDASPNTGFWIYDSTPYQGYVGWYGVGGTSAGAPQWAALIAIADQIHGYPNSNALGLGLVNLAIYNIGNSTSYTSNFHDITSGSDSNGYSATVGWDPVTGWGSPIASSIALNV